MRSRTLASKYPSKSPCPTSSRWAAHHWRSAATGANGGPLMDTTARTRDGAWTAAHSERAPPIEAPPQMARSIPSPSRQCSRTPLARVTSGTVDSGVKGTVLETTGQPRHGVGAGPVDDGDEQVELE